MTNYLERIDSIYAILSTDEGGEGVVAGSIGPARTMMPLIAADEVRLKDILPYARSLAKSTGMRMRLVRFTTREVIEEIEP